MTPTDLREFAENLYTSGTAQEMEFAKEILENLNFVENAEHEELCKDIQYYVPVEMRTKNARDLVEWIGDRSNLLKDVEETMLAEYAERLDMAEINFRNMDFDD